MDIQIFPAPLSGSIRVPPSKSAAHRALLCASLTDGESQLRGVTLDRCAQDLLATIQVARALGAQIDPLPSGDGIRVRGPLRHGGDALLDCAESGSTERFFLPVSAALGIRATFTGHGRLPLRPIGPLAVQMQKSGVAFSRTDAMPFTISGSLRAGRYVLPGNVSSQYLSGLLFALPLLHGDSSIETSSLLESAGYVDMTCAMLRKFGIAVNHRKNVWHVPGAQTFRPTAVELESDWSGAAFWLCAHALGAPIDVQGLSEESLQGDRAIVPLLRHMREGGTATSPLRIDAAPIPDLVPILCVAAAGRKGTTEICGAARLRLKECDRLSAMAACITHLGGKAEELPDGLRVFGTGRLQGGTVQGCNDHRIVMAAAIASIICQDPVIVQDAQAVAKSYPDFFLHFKHLGGVVHVL